MKLSSTRTEAREKGDLYYFTGKPCNKGHTSKRMVSNSGCHECKKLAQAITRRTPEHKEKMRKLQAKRRHNETIKAAELKAQSIRRKTETYRAKVRPSNRAYKKANRDKYNAYSAKREAEKGQRSPSWLSEQDKKDIIEIYRQSRKLTKMTNIEHHVDHIVPLCGALVSGLHVPWNLQVLTGTENMQKNNSFMVS